MCTLGCLLAQARTPCVQDYQCTWPSTTLISRTREGNRIAVNGFLDRLVLRLNEMEHNSIAVTIPKIDMNEWKTKY